MLSLNLELRKNTNSLLSNEYTAGKDNYSVQVQDGKTSEIDELVCT